MSIDRNCHDCSVISTVTDQGEMRRLDRIRFAEPQHVDSLPAPTVNASNRTIFLFLNQFKVYQSRPVREWLALAWHDERIEVHHPPGHPAEFNPMQAANAALEEAVTTCPQARKKIQFGGFATWSFLTLQWQPKRIIGMFEKGTGRYAAWAGIMNAGSSST